MKMFNIYDNNDFTCSVYGVSIDDIDDMVLTEEALDNISSYEYIHNMKVGDYVDTVGLDYTIERIE